MNQVLEFDAALLRKYDQSGPRYTSYPTAVQFTEDFTGELYAEAMARPEAKSQALSLYIHLPFCDTVCFYCGCNKIATKDHQKVRPYLHALYQEMAQQAALCDTRRVVEQLHWGGGTPTFLSDTEISQLMEKTHQLFTLAEDHIGEYSIEIDPRKANAKTIRLLRSLGFNRLSVGVQDFHPAVQKAVNRIQSRAETLAVIDTAKAIGFHSISVDLIYGLPHQTEQTFAQTLAEIIHIQPDRLSVFNYAHMPALFKPQRRIEVTDLPSADEKLRILHRSIQQLLAAGYVHIGMDHFAKPDDALVVAQQQGQLHRNFQGYSTHAECDLIGLGVSSIGKIGHCFSQNVRTTQDYYAAINAGRLPRLRGWMLSADDRVRSAVIMALMCHYTVDFATIETRYSVVFKTYFATALARLSGFEADGLLTCTAQALIVHPKGRLLIRNIAMQFDAYLSQTTPKGTFSKVI